MSRWQALLIAAMGMICLPLSTSRPAFACGGLFDVLCNAGKALEQAGNVFEKAGRDAGHAAEKSAQNIGKTIEKTAGNRQLVPVRAYLRSADIPPTEFGAYGIMAFRAKPTSVTRERLKMACASFIAYLARQIEVPKSIPLSDQMLTIWPLDSPDADEAKKDNCDFLLDHYELYGADSAINDASKQGAQFGNDGPFLIGWSPSNTRGISDKLVLVIDMSLYSSQDSFNQALRFWKEKIVEDPALWRSGFSLEKFKLSIRDFVDDYGGTMLAAAHLSKN